MSNIDYDEGISDKPKGISDVEKFRVLVRKYPHLFIHYKIFAHLIAGIPVEKPTTSLHGHEYTCLDLEKARGLGLKLSTQKEIFSFYGDEFIYRLKRTVYNIARKYYDMSSRAEAIPSAKDILFIMKEETFKTAKERLEELKDKLEKKNKTEIKLDLNEHDEILNNLINKIIDSKTKIVNQWIKEGATGSIQQDDTKISICTLFNISVETMYAVHYDTDDFGNSIISNPTIEKNKKTEESNNFLIHQEEKISEKEKKELDGIDLVNINLEQYKYRNSNFLYSLAERLQKNNKFDLALNILEIILESCTEYSYAYRGKILHLKAIILSSATQGKWDEAIDILTMLYKFAEYHKKDPEIITLIGSNYKRKAFFSDNETLLDGKSINIKFIHKALSYYEQSIQVSDTKYYDAINIVYIRRMLKYINGEYKDKSIKEIRELEKNDIRFLYDDVKYEFEPNSINWWHAITQAEFYMLLGDDATLEYYYSTFEGTRTHAYLSATIRQLEIYTHFVDDDVAKGFLVLLKADLGKL